MRALEYTLEFSNDRPERAALSAAVLDPTLHSERRAWVEFEELPSLDKRRPLVIESFHINSMLAYLHNQETIRECVERQLTEARAAWLGQPLEAAPAVWNDSHFDHLWLPCMKHNLADGGTRQTESMFILVFNVAWDEEHVTRTAKFRDGRFVSLGIEGD